MIGFDSKTLTCLIAIPLLLLSNLTSEHWTAKEIVSEHGKGIAQQGNVSLPQERVEAHRSGALTQGVRKVACKPGSVRVVREQEGESEGRPQEDRADEEARQERR